MSTEPRPTSPENKSQNQRYHRLPGNEDHHDHHADNSAEDEDADLLQEISSSSFVDSPTAAESNNNNNGIFRRSSWTGGKAEDDIVDGAANMSTAASSTVAASSSALPQAAAAGQHPRSAASSPLHMAASRSNSGGSLDLADDLSDWEDDDEAGLRRYHLDFAAVTTDNIPVPAEFSHDSLGKRLWQSFLELRTAARQRRAARLLTMPSESFVYKLHACLLTWCCDATDRGILLVACCLLAWLTIGWMFGMPSSWWWIGLGVFIIRISARRAVESCLQGRQKRLQRQRISTETIELGAADAWRDNNNNNNNNTPKNDVPLT